MLRKVQGIRLRYLLIACFSLSLSGCYKVWNFVYTEDAGSVYSTPSGKFSMVNSTKKQNRNSEDKEILSRGLEVDSNLDKELDVSVSFGFSKSKLTIRIALPEKSSLSIEDAWYQINDRNENMLIRGQKNQPNFNRLRKKKVRIYCFSLSR